MGVVREVNFSGNLYFRVAGLGPHEGGEGTTFGQPLPCFHGYHMEPIPDDITHAYFMQGPFPIALDQM